MTDTKSTFEESMKKLEQYAQGITKSDIALEDAIECYKKGMEEYENCRKILDEAKQKIEIIGNRYK